MPRRVWEFITRCGDETCKTQLSKTSLAPRRDVDFSASVCAPGRVARADGRRLVRPVNQLVPITAIWVTFILELAVLCVHNVLRCGRTTRPCSRPVTENGAIPARAASSWTCKPAASR